MAVDKAVSVCPEDMGPVWATLRSRVCAYDALGWLIDADDHKAALVKDTDLRKLIHSEASRIG